MNWYTKITTSVVFGAAVLLLFLSALDAPCHASETTSWTVGDRNCSLEEGTPIACGNYGLFYVDTEEKCEGGAFGADDPQSYPLPKEAPELVPVPIEPFQRHSANVAGVMPDPIDGLPTEPWIGIVDFLFKKHGLAVQWLAEELSLGTSQSVIFHVDDPDLLQDLGEEVGDFHLLASLCSIAELVDIDGAPAPSVVNMSLGRLPRFDDEIDFDDCNSGALLCQIGYVIEHLRKLEVDFIAAGGNHRKKLIPAALSNVASVVSADLRRLLEDTEVEPSWESPQAAQGVFPANGLCLRGGVPAPAGSSYASAIFSGWFTQAKQALPHLDPVGPRVWKPLWRPDGRCFVLSGDGVPVTRCNAAFDEVITELSGGPGNCWAPLSNRVVFAGPGGTAVQFPTYDSFDEWAALHPTPEADPCVPCMGGPPDDDFVESNDLIINISHSKELPDNEYVREIYLRVGEEFYPLNIHPDNLLAIGAAQVDYLWLPGWRSFIDFQVSASVFYVVANTPDIDCSAGPSLCYWSSSQVTWHPALL